MAIVCQDIKVKAVNAWMWHRKQDNKITLLLFLRQVVIATLMTYETVNGQVEINRALVEKRLFTIGYTLPPRHYTNRIAQWDHSCTTPSLTGRQ